MKLRVAKKILRREKGETLAKDNAFFSLFGLGPYHPHQIAKALAQVAKHYGRPRITMDALPALPAPIRPDTGAIAIKNLRGLAKNMQRFRQVGRLLAPLPVHINSLPGPQGNGYAALMSTPSNRLEAPSHE